MGLSICLDRDEPMGVWNIVTTIEREVVLGK